MTFSIIVGIGLLILVTLLALLDRTGAPRWVVWLPWWLPTAAAITWLLARPMPAVATDDDDDSWTGYAIRYVLVGEDGPRPLALRLLAALLFGAPVAWSLVLLGLASIVGIV